MSLWGRKKAPAGALSPSTVLLRGTLSVYKTKQLYCALKKKSVSFWEKKSKAPAGALSPSTELFVSTTYKFCLYSIHNLFV